VWGSIVVAEARTATIVVTDLAGSTRLRTEVGEARADELRRAHDALLSEQASAHGGTVIKGLGDGLLIAFAGAAEALSAAVAMQQALHLFAARERTPLAMRVGVAAGDVAFEDGDCFGTPVIEAARLCAAAPNGSIYLADMVRLLARGRADLDLATIGPLELKGLSDPLEASELHWQPTERPVDLRAAFPYAGRAREREQLVASWRAADAGNGGLALIAGEPGIGKTRLVNELCNEARAGGATVLFGGCHDGDVVAYAPFVEAITSWVRNADASSVPDVLGAEAAVVARLVPAIADVVEVGEPLAVSPEAETARLLDAVAQVVLRLAAVTNAGVVLVVDDLHWADDATVGMLRAVSRAARGARLLVIGTYRETDVDRRHPFAQGLGVLQREVEPVRIALTGLDTDDVHDMLQRIAEHEVRIEFAEMLATETEGNPFFLRETLLHLIDEGELRFADGVWTLTRSLGELGIPAGVRDVIGRRLSRLSDTANKLLAAGALFEVAFPLTVVADVVEIDDDDALDAVDEALQAGIVRASGEFDHYAFTHALFRHTLVEELNPSRQVRMHRAIANALEKRLRGVPTPVEAAALARHFQRSAALANAERGVPYAVLAADDAARRYARREEHDALDIALELLPDGDDRLLDLRRRRAEAAVFADLGTEALAREIEDTADLVAAAEGDDAACTFVARLASESFSLDDIRVPWRLSALGRRWLAPDRRDAAYCTLRTFELAEREYSDPEHPGIPLDTPERRELLDLVVRIPPSEFGTNFGFSPRSRAEAAEYLEFARADLDAAGAVNRFALIGPHLSCGDCGATRDDLAALADDHRRRGIVTNLALDLAILSRYCNILGEFDVADAALTEGVALLPRIPATSNGAFQLSGAAALNARVRGVRLPVEVIDAFSTWDGSPDTRWAWMVVVAARAYALSTAGRFDEAMGVYHEVLPIVEQAGGWAQNYGLLVDELARTLWYAQRTDRLDVLEHNLRTKLVEPDVRYPETDSRWSLALLCALKGHTDEAAHWFADARRVLTEQQTWPLIVDADHDEALMHLRLGAQGDQARVDELLASMRARCTHPAMAPWLDRISELEARR
jgi:class 3 adenylate cyclase